MKREFYICDCGNRILAAKVEPCFAGSTAPVKVLPWAIECLRCGNQMTRRELEALPCG